MSQSTPGSAPLSVEEKRRLLIQKLQKKAERGNTFPLSFAQQRLWMVHQMDPASPAYNMPHALRLRGPVNEDALSRALTGLVRRHESLRTVFPAHDGAPVQLVRPPAPVVPDVRDLRHLDPDAREAQAARLAHDESVRPFDLAAGPLLRVTLLRLADDETMVLFTMHHIVGDGWSQDVLVRDLSELYTAAAGGADAQLAPLPVQYADFATWQHGWLTGAVLQEQIDYWRTRLDGAPLLLDLPLDRPRAGAGTRAALRELTLSARTSAALRTLSLRDGNTPFITLCAALQALLARWTGQDDFVIGTPVAGRGRMEVENLIGFFVNLLALRADVSGDPTFRALVGRVRETVLEAHAHQDLPFEKLVDELQPARNLTSTPIFQVLFSFRTGALETLRLGELEVERVPGGLESAKYDLSVSFGDDGTLMVGAFTYRADLFHPETIARMAGEMERLLDAVAADPDLPLSAVDLLGDADRRMLEPWTRMDAPVPEEPVHRVFEAHAARTPDALAVAGDDARLSYAALNARANRLAHRLRALGVGPDVRVATCMDRGVEAVVAALGVLKAGGAYVALDPRLPPARLEFMVADSGSAVLVVPGGADPVPGAAVPVVRLDDASLAGECAENPDAAVLPEHLAYAVYTSGSTGTPKGVATEHRQLTHYLAALRDRLGMEDGIRCATLSPLSADIGHTSVFAALASGGTLHVISDARLLNGAGLADYFDHNPVDLLKATPSHLAALQASVNDPRRLMPRRWLVLGGEASALAWADGLRRMAPEGCAVISHYGPTEATVGVLAGAVTAERAETRSGTLPLGRPLGHVRAYVVDDRMRAVPPGVAGELLVGGPQVARGYLGRPGLTAERFVPDPFGAGRLYRTGDRVRLLPDGTTEFLGRMDGQVKVRGFRIEPGEIEAALRAHPGVLECAVVARQDAPGDTRLVAYVVASADADADVLRAHLRERLPEHMVPSAFVALDRLPLMASGKLDRRALPAPDYAPAEARYVAARTPIEQTLAEIWRDLLGVQKIGRDDGFFELGGHSLLIMRMQARLSDRLGRDVPILDLFRHPTIASLARHLEGGDAAEVRADGAARADETPWRDDPAPSDDAARADDPARADGTMRSEASSGDADPPASGGGSATVSASPVRARRRPRAGDGEGFAIVGMAGRFPGAADVEAYWRNLRDGVHAISFFSDDEMRAAGVAPERLADPHFVRAGGVMKDADRFDAEFFGFNPREAEILDPQHRVFLETTWEALENAGYAPGSTPERIGVFAGSSASSYFTRNVMSHPEIVAAVGYTQAKHGNDKDFLATRAAHKLNLRGPAIAVQTGCSSGLVAVHLACQALAAGDCGIAVAGGVSVRSGPVRGYQYTPNGIVSPDGFCRSFDAHAAGTVDGNGVALVVLKRLSDALADGDTIHAVVRGTAVNNDGAQKVGYTAPSVEGQAEVIADALAAAGVAPESIGYVEAHGSGTHLGDPIEVAALTQAFGPTPERQYCAIGSVKTNIGHLDAAAGTAGLIKATLSVRNGQIPPSLHFTAPNPNIDFASSPFFVNAALRPWEGDGPRRAGVSSFGVGGTNAHVVLEQAPAPEPSTSARQWQTLTLSARSPEALEAATDRLASHLRANPDQSLADAAWTLQVGRRGFPYRRAVVARDGADAADALERRAGDRVFGGVVAAGAAEAAFLIPGLGNQHPGMGRGLYETEPLFREIVDHCAQVLEPMIGVDLRTVLYPAEHEDTTGVRAVLDRASAAYDPAEPMMTPRLGHTALFVTQYALARQWMRWGVHPRGMAGHSLGEYVAAAVAGVWSLDDALALTAERAMMIEQLPPGAVMGIGRPPEDVRPWLTGNLGVFALNGPGITVVSGPVEEVEALQATLAERRVRWRRLSHPYALHSTMMRPVAERLEEMMRGMRMHAPRIPFATNVTGTWIRDDEATDPAFWTRHLCGTVRFYESVETLIGDRRPVVLELGSGHGLRMLTRQMTVWEGNPPEVIATLRHGLDRADDHAHLAGALGQVWAHGVDVDWRAVHRDERLRRIPLPTYPFQRRRYWIDPAPFALPAASGAPSTVGAASPDGVYVPAWTRAPLAPAAPLEPSAWLVLADESGLGGRLAGRLEALGHTAVVVEANAGFRRTGDRGYTVRPGAPADFAALNEALAAAGIHPRHVVHLWGVGPAGTAEDADGFAAAQARGFATVAALAGWAREDAPLRMTVVTDGARDVAGGEPVDPARAAVLGACEALGRAHPHVTLATLDLRAVGGAGAVVDALLAEVTAEPAETPVALRGRRRWALGWQPAPASGAAGIRRHGTYVMTGATMAAGAAPLLQQIAGMEARLAVVAPATFPERDAWDGHGSAAPADDPHAPLVRALRAAEARGAEVRVHRADAADAEALRSVLHQVRDAFGRVDGVLHALDLDGVASASPAGSAGSVGSVESAGSTGSVGSVGSAGSTGSAGSVGSAGSAGSAESAADAAAAGLARMDAELRALRDATAALPLEFVVLLHPPASGAGSAARGAARALADAWAQRASADGGARWISAAREGGADAPPAQVAAVLARLAALEGEPRVLVSPTVPDARVRRAEGASAAPAAAAEPQTAAVVETATFHPRPALASSYHAPTNPAEEMLAGVWRELLGIEQIGIHDDFFHLGGHSLLGMQVVSRVRETFAVELPLRAVFEAPTVATLAALVEEAIRMELEEMTEDDAMTLAGEVAR